MKALIIVLLLVSALLLTSCQQAEIQPPAQGVQEQIEPAADTDQYIDGQFIEQDDTIEIGEMV